MVNLLLTQRQRCTNDNIELALQTSSISNPFDFTKADQGSCETALAAGVDETFHKKYLHNYAEHSLLMH